MVYMLIIKDAMRGTFFIICCDNEVERDGLEEKYMNDNDYDLIRICNYVIGGEHNVFGF